MEISKDIHVDEKCSVLVDMHSLYNVLNIISGELQVLQVLADDNEILQEGVKRIFSIKDGLEKSSTARECAQNIDRQPYCLLASPD